MLLGEILHPETIHTSLSATDKFQAIEELTELMIRSGALPNALRDHALEIVRAREASGSTGMEHGIALPHASSDRIDQMIGALGIAREGIDWDCLDGKPARLIILLLLPRRKFQTHVRTLAGISHLLNDAALCSQLVAAPDAHTVLNLIRREEQGGVFRRFRFLRG